MKDRKPSVLLVDDDLVYRYAAKKMIKSTGLAGKIEECTNAIDALKYLKENISTPENLPDIIFLDINMPAMDGWEFLNDYIPIAPSMPTKIYIYIVSSSIDKIDISRAKEISIVTDYLIKPVFKEKFGEILQNIHL
jgi:CheY-like chemotaxis protein